MEIIHYPNRLPQNDTVVTVGFFDGVHLGHKFLIEQLISQAQERRLSTVVVTFVEHPRKVTLSSYQPELLTTIDEKLSLLEETGIDYCYLIDFTKELSSLSAQEFMADILIDKLNCQCLLMGYDHKFGSDRISGLEGYRKIGDTLGLEIVMSNAFESEAQQISSSLVRRMLRQGSVGKATRLLDHPYRLIGSVVHGKKVGREIGFPTANLLLTEHDKLAPCNGVYLVKVSHVGFSKFGMMNIGNRPSLYIKGDLTLEVYLFDFDGDLYEKELMVEFLEYIRSEKEFKSLDDLIEQLKEDHRLCLSMIPQYT